MSHAKNNRQVRIPGPNDHDISDLCRKFGINHSEERKLRILFGKHASVHEIQANAPPRQPKFR
jgi:hypothetical protein